MVSDPVAADQEPQTVQALRDMAEGFNGRIKVDSNVPYGEVKAAWESAAVGMVLTTGPEPFGRTALEALASGAALITSGRGGLAEICGPCAVTVEPSDAGMVSRRVPANCWMRLSDAQSSLAPDVCASRRCLISLNHCAADGRIHRRLLLGEGRGQAQLSHPGRQSDCLSGARSVSPESCLAFGQRRRKAGPRDDEPRDLEIPVRQIKICSSPRAARTLARELRPLSRQLRDLRAALLRPAVDAHLHARLFDFSGRGEPLPVCGDGRIGGCDDLRRNAVRCLGAQEGDDGFAGRRCGGDASRRLLAGLDDAGRTPRADRPCALRCPGVARPTPSGARWTVWATGPVMALAISRATRWEAWADAWRASALGLTSAVGAGP